MTQVEGGVPGPERVELQVAPEDLYSQARDYDHMANMAEAAINENRHGLVVEAPGADVVSQEAARRLNASAFDPVTGLIPQMEVMVANFRTRRRSCGPWPSPTGWWMTTWPPTST